MTVQMIAHTALQADAILFEDECEAITSSYGEGVMTLDPSASDGESLIEYAGRTCYQAYHKPRPETARNSDYIKNIIAQGHESVLEHASATFKVTDHSRNMLLELERHRHLSFSVISQRFVDSYDTMFVMPEEITKLGLPTVTEMGLFEAITEAREVYDRLAVLLTSHGLTRKKAREAARSILPGGIEAQFVVTGNLRAWRDVLRKRYSVHADAEILKFATDTLASLRIEYPSVFADFPDTPFE